MPGSALLVGAVLTFATTDGKELQLTVTLSATAAVALEWGDLTRTASTAGPYTFGPLPAPKDAPLSYRISIAGSPAVTHTVRNISSDSLRIAVYGDTRGGTAPHQRLIEQIAAAHPQVLIHTGDVIRWAGDRAGWTQHLASVLPVSAEVPTVLALGNHELFTYYLAPRPKHDPMVEAMTEVPPPDDRLAKESGAAPSSFHVRVEDTLIVSIDSNVELTLESPQMRFLDRALEENRDAKLKIITMHQGPLCSGPHGGHPQGDVVLALAKKHGVHVIIAGHDHLYERIVQDGLTVLVSGGGGAPLYDRERFVQGSVAFSSTYNWVDLEVGAKNELSAYSLEGVSIDRATIPPEGAGPAEHSFVLVMLAGLIFAGAFGWTVVRIVTGKVR